MVSKRTGIILNISLAVAVYLFSYYYFQMEPGLSATSALLTMIVPISVYLYWKNRKVKQFEETLPTFLSNVHSMLEAQLPLPQAIAIAKDAEYGKLNPLIAKLHNRMELGITFPRAFELFGEETKSRSISSSIAILVSAYRTGGGRLTELFRATAENIRKAQSLEKDRNEQMQAMVVTGYMVFFVFLAVVIIINTSVFSPEGLASLGISGNATLDTAGAGAGASFFNLPTDADYSMNLFYLFLVQAFFSGLLMGEISQGSLVAGLKHTVVLLIVTYVVSLIFLL